MPRLSSWTVRASLVCLALGALLGAALLVAPLLASSTGRSLARLVPVHVELLLVGWLVQFALGVAYWILPRVAGRRPVVWAAWAGAGSVASGVALGVAGGVVGLPLAVTVGRVLELAGGALFGWHVIVRLRRWRTLDLSRREDGVWERTGGRRPGS